MENQIRQVNITELSDRYLVVDAETGENVEINSVGFSDEEAAERWANFQGYEIVQKP